MKTNDMPLERWFETVDAVCGHWTRISDNELVLWFSGYKPQEMHDAEDALFALGGRCTSQDFDRVCGKTAMIIKEPKNLTNEEI
jgi:hypothetical protein